jgi:hypothetical protein
MVDLGAGANYVSGFSSSGKSQGAYNFMLGIKGRYTIGQTDKWFLNSGLRLSYQNAYNKYENAAISARTDNLVTESNGVTLIEAALEPGFVWKFIEPSLLLTLGMGSVFHDGMLVTGELYRGRTFGPAFSLSAVNGFRIWRKVTLRIELGLRKIFYVNPSDMEIFLFMLSVQYRI